MARSVSRRLILRMSAYYFQAIEGGTKQVVETQDLIGSRSTDHNRDVVSEQLIAGFKARQASLAYQEMLVSGPGVYFSHPHSYIISYRFNGISFQLPNIETRSPKFWNGHKSLS